MTPSATAAAARAKASPVRSALGQHSLFDFHGCDAAVLRATEQLREEMLKTVRAAGGTIVNDTFHTFSPHGVSGVIVIAESHVTLHTWPEFGYAAVDVFSCGVTLRHEMIRDHLARILQAARVEQRAFPRGAVER
jgi:S-adenosylmethionine decarboxylase proenzyme